MGCSYTYMNNVALSTRTALIVEDDQALLDVLHEVLTDAGFETTAIDRGGPAMRLLAKQRFDVLLVDVNLPDMSGMILCDTARERYQDQIVILVLTGVNIERRRLSSLQVCADDFLGKPFDLNELRTRIESKLRRAPTTPQSS